MIRTTKIIKDSAKKPILADSRYENDGMAKPVIIFSHGFKGYKDWGAFNLMADYFAAAGFVFVKFNFSHNGGTMEDPIDFPDLEAFGNNNYSIELDDLGLVIDAVLDGQLIDERIIDKSQINLMGHSRGGGISILKAAEDSRIAKLVTLAAVSDFANRFPKGQDLEEWQNCGIQTILNSRTKQNMPLYFQFYRDFITNKDRLDISTAAKKLKIPYLIVHGDADETVSPQEAKHLLSCCPAAKLLLIPHANHTFGMKQPWEATTLPTSLKNNLSHITNFLL